MRIDSSALMSQRINLLRLYFQRILCGNGRCQKFLSSGDGRLASLWLYYNSWSVEIASGGGGVYGFDALYFLVLACYRVIIGCFAVLTHADRIVNRKTLARQVGV